MKFLFIFFFLISFNCCNANINLDSLRMEKAIIEDTSFLNEHLDDSLIYIHSNGLIETKNSFILSLTTDKITYQKANFKSYQTIEESSTLINTGEVWVEGLFEKNPFSVKLKFNSIYKKVKGNWRLTYWQSTKIG